MAHQMLIRTAISASVLTGVCLPVGAETVDCDDQLKQEISDLELDVITLEFEVELGQSQAGLIKKYREKYELPKFQSELLNKIDENVQKKEQKEKQKQTRLDKKKIEYSDSCQD